VSLALSPAISCYSLPSTVWWHSGRHSFIDDIYKSRLMVVATLLLVLSMLLNIPVHVFCRIVNVGGVGICRVQVSVNQAMNTLLQIISKIIKNELLGTVPSTFKRGFQRLLSIERQRSCRIRR
jgi:hypothetical protein